MHLVKLLSVIICILSVCSFATAQVCGSSGFVCSPGDCCNSYQLCAGTQFWPVQPTAPGTNCKDGRIVAADACSNTPCRQAAPSTQQTQKPTVPATVAPATQAPPPTQQTQKPVTVAPTVKATVTPATEKPATQAPATPAPATQAPATPAPTIKVTERPATPAPTVKVTIAPVTQAPVTEKPATQAPVTQAPVTQKPATPAPTQSSGKCSLADVLTQDDFDHLFPHANGAYLAGLTNQHAIFNYTYLLMAAKRFPTFACEGDVATRKREVAAFLAHTSQETSGWWAGQPYNWGFYFSTEVGCTNPSCTQYCERYSTEYPCAAGKGYFGRGPIQLSWNYNYGQVSEYLYGNDVLLRNPDMMFDESGTAFTTALWFWMTAQSPKPSCHSVMSGSWVPNQLDINAGRKPGFGMTTNIINGGLECGFTTSQKVLNRIGYYRTYASYLGVATGDNLECNTMHSY